MYVHYIVYMYMYMYIYEYIIGQKLAQPGLGVGQSLKCSLVYYMYIVQCKRRHNNLNLQLSHAKIGCQLHFRLALG